MGIGSNKGMTLAHLNTGRDFFFLFFPVPSHDSPLPQISSCSVTTVPSPQACCVCLHNHHFRCLATQFPPGFGSPVAAPCALTLHVLAHDCLLLLPSSFAGWACLCQERKDQSTSVSTSNELHFFEFTLTYLWRQKKKQEMSNKKWNIGNRTKN